VYRWMPRLREVTLVPKVEGVRRKTCARTREVVRTLGGTVHGLARRATVRGLLINGRQSNEGRHAGVQERGQNACIPLLLDEAEHAAFMTRGL
jgi:hypothetical protein